MTPRPDHRDVLLDRPSWAPSWIPSIDDVRQVRMLRWALAAVFAAGLAACVARGADNPADPVLGEVRPAGALAARFGTVIVDLVTAAGQAVTLCLLDANDSDERGQGLMGVTDLGGYDGMLFRHDGEVESQFVMIGTPMPLSITWWRADGLFRSGTDMTPCIDEAPDECARYAAGGPYRWAIEVPQGALADAGLGEESRLTVGETGCVPG